MSETLEKLAVFDGDAILIQNLEDIWMTQKQMAELYGTTVQNINKHIVKLKQKLDSETLKATINQKLIVQNEGNREVERETEFYGFEMICQVGYRVDTQKGIKFRDFATKAVMEKINRDMLNRDEEINQLRIEKETYKARLGEAVMEISELRQELDYASQYVPDESEYGKTNKNGQRKLTYQKGGFKANNGRKVRLKPQYVTIDLIALGKYLMTPDKPEDKKLINNQ